MQTAITGIHALQFQNTRFDIVDRNGQPWLRLLQIGSALRYSKADLVGRIYQKHADEFTDSMTAVIKMPTAGGVQDTRIFSLRGAHLLAMLSRTEVAKDFRRWVLDILERESAVSPAPTFGKAKSILQATRLFQATQKAHHGLSVRQSYLLAASAAQEAFGVDLLAVWKLDLATLPDASPQAALARLTNKNGKRRLLEKLLRYIEAASPIARHQDMLKRMHLTADEFRALVDDAVANGLLLRKSGAEFNYAGTIYVLVGGAA
jgi:hypothetical protein